LGCQADATAAVAPAYEELAAQLPTEPVLGIDESPTKEAQAKTWLWTFVAGNYTLFALRATRAATVLHELLTDEYLDEGRYTIKVGIEQSGRAGDRRHLGDR
jgi:hypothetical protein